MVHLFTPSDHLLFGGGEMKKIDMSLDARIWRKIHKNETTGCWEWNGCIHVTSDHAIVMRSPRDGEDYQRNIQVHQYLWVQKYGSRERKLYHTCQTHGCVNPDHYTPKMPFKRADVRSKLSSAQKKFIRKAWALSERYKTTMDKLGERFGVTRQRIEQIVNHQEPRGRDPLCSRGRA